nr:PREDICTED: LOW QUALITY PROTEIN: ribosomal protein S6 kinase alpha-5 [Linepithema humile]
MRQATDPELTIAMDEEEKIAMDEASTSSTKRLQQQDESIDLAHVDIVTYAPGFDPWVEPCVGVESIVERSVPASPMKKKQNDSGYSEGSCGDFEVSDVYHEQHDQADFSGSPDSDNDVIVIGEVFSNSLTEVANWQGNQQNIPSRLVEIVDLVVRDSIAQAVDDRNVGNSVEIIEDVTEDCRAQIVDDLDDSVEIIDNLSSADSGRQDTGDNADDVNADSAVNVKDSVDDDPYGIYREPRSVNLTDNGNQKVDRTHFDLLKVLGTGAYGKVFLVRKKMGTDAGRLYAMKVLKKATIVSRRKTTEHTKTERQILEAIRDSPFLITLYYAFQTEDKLYLILEYIPGGEMFMHLYQNECFTEDAVRIYIGEIILALERLHELGIIYRDIKLENILLDREGHIVLTDFGLSKEFLPHERNGNARTYSFCGTIEYMAPEVVRGGPNGHNIAVDWWSVGVLTFELLTGASPFTVEGEKNTQSDISKRILNNDPPAMPSHLSANVSDFITRLLVKDPRQRLGGGPRDAKELKEHPFFMSAAPAFTWEALERKQIRPPFVPEIKDELDTSNFSEEFTKMNVNSPSSVTDDNKQDKHFWGYSYVAPSVLFTDNAVSRDIFGDEEGTRSQRPSMSNLLATHFEESAFFQIYELDREAPALGDGSFSICLRCRHRQTQQEYAVKIVSQRVDCSREENLLRVCQGNPYVVKLIGVYNDRAHTYFVMELLSGGELLQRRRSFSERQARRVMRQLASAVRYMHTRGVVHRDLKPENIVFVHQGEDSPVKIVDFGFARMKSNCEPLHTPCFTLPYAAPEVLARQEYDESCDMWSLGTILYFMLSGIPLSPEMAARIRAGEINLDSNVWSHASNAAKLVMKSLLMVDPSKRLTANDLVYHPWLMNNNTMPPVTPSDAVHVDQTATTSSISTFERANDSFRLRAVDFAKLAQRRKHKCSTSSSSTSRPSSSSSSSPSSVQLLHPPSAAVSNVTTTASTLSPSAFDFSEERVNEYLSSLSSSSDSNSPRLPQPQERFAGKTMKRTAKRKHNTDLDSSCQQEAATKHRHRRDVDEENSGSNSNGPMTRSRKRKLDELVNYSDSSAESYESSTQVATRDETNVHRKHKAGKRSKRLPTVVVE